MKLLKKYLNSKNGLLETCEDAIVFNDHFAGVIDGASSSQMGFGDKSGGKIASDIVVAAIGRLPADVKAETAFEEIDQALANYYRKYGVYEYLRDHPEKRPAASAAIYSDHYRQIWMVSDCQALVDERLVTNSKKVDDLIANIRAFLLEFELSKGKSIGEIMTREDLIIDTISALIAKQSAFQNSRFGGEFSYAALDGFLTDYDTAIRTVNIPPETQVVVLASDGYPYLLPSLLETENALASVIEEDPLCFRRFKSVKGVRPGNISFDDRAYLKFSL